MLQRQVTLSSQSIFYRQSDGCNRLGTKWRCWSKVGVHLSGEECDDDDDPFAGEELLALDRLIYQVQDPTDEPDGITPEEYINDDNVPCFQPLIDVDNMSGERKSEMSSSRTSEPNQMSQFVKAT